MKAKKPRSYRATESTLINVGAGKKRDATLTARIAKLERGSRSKNHPTIRYGDLVRFNNASRGEYVWFMAEGLAKKANEGKYGTVLQVQRMPVIWKKP